MSDQKLKRACLLMEQARLASQDLDRAQRIKWVEELILLCKDDRVFTISLLAAATVADNDHRHRSDR